MLLVPVLTTCPTTVCGQDENDLAKITLFEGGRIDMSLGAASLALLGPGAAGLQTSVAPVYAGPGRHLQNPALLGMARRTLLAVDYGPELSLDLASRFGLGDEIAESTEDALSDHLADDGEIRSSDATARLVHPGGLRGAALLQPAGPVAIAAGLDRAFELDFSLLASGMQGWADIEKQVGDQTEVVHMRADLDLSSSLQMMSQRYSLAVGGQLRPDLWAGAGFDWLSCQASVDGRLDVEGMMSTSGREFAFGDPADPWENSLDQSLTGLYEGGTWILRMGAGWRPFSRVSIGASYQHGQPLDMPGTAEIVLHRLAAYDEEGGIDPSELSLSSPTETEEFTSPVDDHLRVDFPRSFAVGIAFLAGPLTTTLDYQAFQGNFSLAYLDSHFELGPRQLFKLGLYTPHVSLSLGALLSEPRFLIDGEWKEPGMIPLPLLALGGGGRIMDWLRVDAVFEAAPTPAFKISTGILF